MEKIANNIPEYSVVEFFRDVKREISNIIGQKITYRVLSKKYLRMKSKWHVNDKILNSKRDSSYIFPWNLIKIYKFLESLSEQKILFKLSRPLTSNSTSITYKKLVNTFNIPTSCFDCLELFKVEKDQSIIFCNGMEGIKLITDYDDREEIYKEFEIKLTNLNEFSICFEKVKK